MIRCGMLLLVLVFSSGSAHADPVMFFGKAESLKILNEQTGQDLNQFKWKRFPRVMVPEAALENAVDGFVRVKCILNADGGMQACLVIEETPRGYGFGGQVLTALSDKRQNPQIAGYQENNIVILPFRFDLEID